MSPTALMQLAIDLSLEAARSDRGGPFGALIAQAGVVLATGTNQVLFDNDPTAHAEMVAIRSACRQLGTFSLAGCELFTSCEPCPMCLGAICWARLDCVYYANTRADAAAIGFDDEHFYREMALQLHQRQVPFVQLLRDEAWSVFQMWNGRVDKRVY